MDFIIKNSKVLINNKLIQTDVFISQGKIKEIRKNINYPCKSYDFKNHILVPGLIDVHTHLREPGYEYKETIKSGTKAAAHGGYTDICCMPNLNPNTDSLKTTKNLLKLIKDKALINVYPFCSITKGRKGKGEIVDIKKISKYAIGFSDDGTGVSDQNLMLKAMKEVKNNSSIISAHCEDLKFIEPNGSINQCLFSKKNNIPSISNESEYKPVERDLMLAKKTGCKYHVCHISTKETIELINKFKIKNVSCEVTPHHLLLNDSILSNHGKYKVNPPLRSIKDQKALIENLKKGNIDLIATDHAPHAAKEKNNILIKSAFGIASIDYAFPLLYTNLVLKKIISLPKLITLMSLNANKIFTHLPNNEIKINNRASFMIFDPKKYHNISKNKILSKSKVTPFEGWKCTGWVKMTVCNGKIVYYEK